MWPSPAPFSSPRSFVFGRRPVVPSRRHALSLNLNPECGLGRGDAPVFFQPDCCFLRLELLSFKSPHPASLLLPPTRMLSCPPRSLRLRWCDGNDFFLRRPEHSLTFFRDFRITGSSTIWRPPRKVCTPSQPFAPFPGQGLYTPLFPLPAEFLLGRGCYVRSDSDATIVFFYFPISSFNFSPPPFQLLLTSSDFSLRSSASPRFGFPIDRRFLLAPGAAGVNSSPVCCD